MSAGENATSEDTQEEATEKPLSNFGSLTASLSDGMVLSLSSYGKEGAPKFKGQNVALKFKKLGSSIIAFNIKLPCISVSSFFGALN